MKNISIISQAPLNYSETFIQAHIDGLHAHVFFLHGHRLNYTFEGSLLRQIYKKKTTIKDRILHLLPYYFVFRIKKHQRQDYSDERLVERFFLEKNIQLVLAEYGTSGSFITPVCKKLNIPLIVHFHGFDSSSFHILNEFREPYKRMFEHASYIISVSHFMTQSLLEIGCPHDKIVYNPCGPNPLFFDILPNYKSNNIIAVGRFTYKKAPYLTLAAFVELLKYRRELNLVFVGDGELLEVCENLVRAWDINRNVKFLGPANHGEIANLFKRSFVFVQHSLTAADGNAEGTPVSILEASAAGLPVVSTNHGGIPDVVINGETGFIVDEGDVTAMAKILFKLAEDRNLVKQLGQNAKLRIKNEFSIERHISTLDSLVSNLIHE